MDSLDKPSYSKEREKLENAISVLEANRPSLDDEVVDIAIATMREKLASLEAKSRIVNESTQRKLVTVLFADVSGFTAMAEAMDHEVVSGLINSLWSRVDKAIRDQGGRIDKHIGDAVMALFGAPAAREDDPERAIRAALQIQNEIQKWKQEIDRSGSVERSHSQNIKLRIGINTGPALLGVVGTIGEYTAIGNTVNLGSRLETAAPVGGILISYDTYQHVRGLFDVTVLEPITVKGKSKPIQVYIVNGVQPRSFNITTRGIEGIETRTIGREAELSKMISAFEGAVAKCRMHLINIVAEAGTGKSRLLYEFAKWLDVQKHPTYLLKGRATQEMDQIPYALLRDLISSSFGILDNDRASVARQKLENWILKDTGDEESASLYSAFIGHLIGLDYSTSPHLKGILGDARQIRDLAFHYTSQFLAEITRERAGVIFLEDIHWADRGSLDFFDYLMNAKSDLPLLVVGLTRSTIFEQRPDWGMGPVENLRLDLLPLSDANCHRLVEEILQKLPSIPPSLTDLIVKKAEGSPFYVEELIKVLIDKGVIIRGEDQWRLEMARLSDLKVPDTLTGLLQARLDSLNIPARETLQQASVVGRIFWTNVLEHMRNPEAQDALLSTRISDRLGLLRSKELIFEYGEVNPSKAPEFIFKSEILHNVTYESVLLRLRPIYHLQAAEGLIGISGERVGEYAGRVGEHYEEAGELLKAADWYARAGKQAQDTYEPEAAVVYYQKALEFLNGNTDPDRVLQRLDIYSQLGNVLNWQARYTDAIGTYKSMLALAEKHNDRVAQSRAMQGLATSQSYKGDHRAALESATHAESLAREAGARTELAKAMWTQGSTRYRLGEPRVALSLGEQALAIATELKNPNEMGRCLNLLGAVHYVLGQHSQAEDYWKSALKIFQELGNRQQGMDLLSNLGAMAYLHGDYNTAFQRDHEALEIAREIGYRDGEIVFLSNRGIAQVALKNYAAAEDDLRRVIEFTGITGSWILSNTYNYYAEALLGLGRYEEASHAAQQGLAQSTEEGSPENIAGAWRALGLVAGTAGMRIKVRERETSDVTDHDARACFSKSERIFAELEIEGERARTLREWAKYEIRSNNKVRGAQLWDEARTIFEKLGADMEAERMKEMPS